MVDLNWTDDYYDAHQNIFDNDPMPGTSIIAALGPRITGVISAICSALIINVIFKSSTKLSSTYHRIMFGMSVCDIVGSLSMGLTTWALPSDNKWVDMYGFEGTRLGNVSTCSAQGFFSMFGTTTMYVYNIALSVYYACIIAFSMSEKKMKKCVEPLLHLFPVIIGLSLSLPFLVLEMFNPAPRAAAWCAMTRLPYNCEEKGWNHTVPPPKCDRGSPESHERMTMVITVVSSFEMVCIFVCLFLTCRKVAATYANVRGLLSLDDLQSGRRYAEQLRQFSSLRATFLLSVSYIIAVFLTMLPPLIALWQPPERAKHYYNIHYVIFPLQGFFNFLIFISGKICHHRRVDSEISVAKALCQIMCRGSYEVDAEAAVFSGVIDLNDINSSAHPTSPSKSERRSDGNSQLSGLESQTNEGSNQAEFGSEDISLPQSNQAEPGSQDISIDQLSIYVSGGSNITLESRTTCANSVRSSAISMMNTNELSEGLSLDPTE